MDEQTQSGPAGSMADQGKRLPVALVLLKSALVRMQRAQDYLPDRYDLDKEAGALHKAIRQTQRFLA